MNVALSCERVPWLNFHSGAQFVSTPYGDLIPSLEITEYFDELLHRRSTLDVDQELCLFGQSDHPGVDISCVAIAVHSSPAGCTGIHRLRRAVLTNDEVRPS